MHGKKREEYKAKTRDPKTAAILAKKAEQWYILMKELQDRRKFSRESEREQHNDNSGDKMNTMAMTLKLLGKALEVNPDPMNLWNHRREVILQEIHQEGMSSSHGVEDESLSSSPPSTITSIVQRERILTQRALEGNPKAYGSWFHRKWILQTFRPSYNILQEELALTKKFLSVDERNFHCWNYRRFVVACLGGSWEGEWTIRTPQPAPSTFTLMGTQIVNHRQSQDTIAMTPKVVIPIELIQSELEFTTEKISQNFSNFSAFHYRSQLLKLCACEDNDDKEAILENEFGLIEDAVCTEPDDQTCWWYHAILLDKIMLLGDSTSLLTALRPRLREQADLFREILDDSPDSKWVILGLFRVLQILGTKRNDKGDLDDDKDVATDNVEEREDLLRRLIAIDPYRSKRYQELQQKVGSSDGRI